jgi:hypothetical protein
VGNIQITYDCNMQSVSSSALEPCFVVVKETRARTAWIGFNSKNIAPSSTVATAEIGQTEPIPSVGQETINHGFGGFPAECILFQTKTNQNQTKTKIRFALKTKIFTQNHKINQRHRE